VYIEGSNVGIYLRRLFPSRISGRSLPLEPIPGVSEQMIPGELRENWSNKINKSKISIIKVHSFVAPLYQNAATIA
jgi:hypothetical protein